MPRPVLLVMDRDRGSLGKMVADLSRRFGGQFAVRGERSPSAAMAALRSSARAEEQIAVIVAPDGDLEFLAAAHELHPRAKRVLLVDRDYSSTAPAVQAIALGRADFHIVRPWADDEMLHGPMSEYLMAWSREQEPAFEMFRIVAADGDSRARQLRDVMARMGMPYATYSVASPAGRRLLDEAGLDLDRLPVVFRYDGRVLVDPDLPALAKALGVNVSEDARTCDVAIVGAGPAGLTAAVYAASEGLDAVLLEEEVSGGQASTSPLIRNYPGFPHGINGGLLMERTCEQAWLMGAHIVFAQRTVALERRGECLVVRMLDGSELSARAVVLSTGIEWRRLGVPRLEALVGSGVFYGAAIGETRAMAGQDVVIVGAGNSAGQAALNLARHARSVTLLCRGDSIGRSMSSYLVRNIESSPDVTVRHNTEAIDGGGDTTLEYLTVVDRATGAVETLKADALFVMIGGEPNTQWLPDEIARDDHGYLLTGPDLGLVSDMDSGRPEPLMLETSMPGVFAAGDVRHGSIKRVTSAVGEGATVVWMLHSYLRAQALEPTA
jgi:thioredoxin reductase (NADPH)